MQKHSCFCATVLCDRTFLQHKKLHHDDVSVLRPEKKCEHRPVGEGERGHLTQAQYCNCKVTMMVELEVATQK